MREPDAPEGNGPLYASTSVNSAIPPNGLEVRSLGDLVERQARDLGERVLFRFASEEMTIREVHEASNRLAHSLKKCGVQSGDRVGIMLPNGFDFPIAWFAVAKLGAVIVPINPEYQQLDLAYILNDSGACLVLTMADRISRLEGIRDRCPQLKTITTAAILEAGDVGANCFHHGVAGSAIEFSPPSIEPPLRNSLLNIQYTSGTTGFPKGCMLTHGYWLRIAEAARGFYRIADGDIAMVAQPFFYMDAQWLSAMCLLAGIPLVILPRFSASTFWQSVKDHDVSVLYLLGTMPLMLMKQSENQAVEKTHRVRLIYCSGIMPALHCTFEARWNAPWRETYGTTESGADLFVPAEDTEAVGTGAMGRPAPGKEVKVIDQEGEEAPAGGVGELVVRGSDMMLGYWNQPAATEEKIRDGWLHTGDLVTCDAKGYYHMVGRLKEMIRRGGENIAATEVESVLCQHPAVRAAAVVSVPDDVRGEEVKAFVQLQPGQASETVPPPALIQFVGDRIAAFKVPRFIEYVEDFPRTPSERIAKAVLLQRKKDQRSGCYDARLESWI
ncbi:MAG: AMP-binding protein [Candidatus Acidiferrales bacterium]